MVTISSNQWLVLWDYDLTLDRRPIPSENWVDRALNLDRDLRSIPRVCPKGLRKKSGIWYNKQKGDRRDGLWSFNVFNAWRMIHYNRVWKFILLLFYKYKSYKLLESKAKNATASFRSFSKLQGIEIYELSTRIAILLLHVRV